ncbi:hypothetical protein H6P81_016003 [Aristolochia fimbriata]|uniref:Uncharacterized protein n=1 Tax=Aristolochia fimbriata TaxID=158543 RepID=A0AAV7EBQ0_ARIFI|nr:hypothetical protein H6P81_016003 [Aristolochia fimbriata]
MMRIRLVSFVVGFTVTGSAFFVAWKDMWGDRYSLSAETARQFGALESRISELESLLRQNADSIQDEV